MSYNEAVAMEKLDGKLTRMLDTIETVKERQEAVYNPDEGLYARVRELESWKSTQTKLMWILVTAAVGAITAMLAGVSVSLVP